MAGTVKRNWKKDFYLQSGVLPEIEAETLPALLKLRAEQYPDEVFMSRKYLGIWQTYTWKEVYAEVESFHCGLVKLGLQAGETVCIGGENEPQMYWTMAVRAKVVCTYPDVTPSELQYILEHSEAVFFVCEDQEQVDKVLEIEDPLPNLRKIIYWDNRGMDHYKNPILTNFQQVQEMGRTFLGENPNLFERNIDRVQKQDTASICYTSGTTGKPKGVVSTHEGLFDNAYRVLMHIGIRPFTRYLSYLSPAWGVEQVYGMTIGMIAPMIVNFPEEPETIKENIRELGVEILILGPRQWEGLAADVQAKMLDAGPIRRLIFKMGMAVGLKVAAARTEGQRISFLWKALWPLAYLGALHGVRSQLGLSKCYFAFSGGAAMAPDGFRFFHALGVDLRNGFGASEIGWLTMHMGNRFNLETLGRWYESHPHFGPPLEFKISEKGELLVKGATGFSGYLKQPEATKEVILDGWYHTGDAVRMIEDGEMLYLDRMKDMRELAGGFRFPPQYIETRLRFSPFIKDVIILGDKNKEFVSCMINIDLENVGRWAEKRQIPYTTFADLSQNQQVRQIIKKEIDRVNKNLEGPSRVRRFVNLPKELDPDDAELTRTRKLRRSLIEERYADIIEAIHAGRDDLECRILIKYQDGRESTLKSTVYVNESQWKEAT